MATFAEILKLDSMSKVSNLETFEAVAHNQSFKS